MKNFFILAICITRLNCLCTSSFETYDHIGDVATLSNLGSFSYSSTRLPYSIPNITMILIQASGMRAYVCQTPSNIDSSTSKIAMQINNRFGTRFCNHHQGQMILQLVCQYLYNTYNNKWSTTDINTVGTPSSRGGSVQLDITPSSSGLIIAVTCPTTAILNTFMFFKRVLSDIYSSKSTLSDTTFDSLCSSAITTINNGLLQAKSPLGGPWQNQHSVWFGTLQPRWDCSSTYGENLGGLFSIPLWSFEDYATNTARTFSGQQTYRDSAKLCLSLFKREKDLTFFVASSSTTVASQIPQGMKLLYDQFNISQVIAFNKIYYGFALPKGEYLFFVRLNGGDSATGGILYLGPISATSMIASELFIQLLSQKAITSGIFDGYLAYTLMPIAGQMTARLSTHVSTSSMTNSWPLLINNLTSRYANGSNTADASNPTYIASIQSAYNKLTPSNSHTIINGDPGLYDSVLPANNIGYLNWMCLFHAGFNSFYDLSKIISGTQTDQTNAMLKAISTLYNAASLNTYSYVVYKNSY